MDRRQAKGHFGILFIALFCSVGGFTIAEPPRHPRASEADIRTSEADIPTSEADVRASEADSYEPARHTHTSQRGRLIRASEADIRAREADI